MDWIQKLDPKQLMSRVPQARVLDSDDNHTIDFVASLMVQSALKKQNEKTESIMRFRTRLQSPRPPKDWWPEVKKEFYVFLCTDNKRYTNLRRKLESGREAASATILSIITAAIASTLGFAAGSITGFVALCLYAMLKIGKEAYCAAKT